MVEHFSQTQKIEIETIWAAVAAFFISRFPGKGAAVKSKVRLCAEILPARSATILK
jgi:hypothetical protein